MLFDDSFVSRLIKINNLELPGAVAHDEVAPELRRQYIERFGIPRNFREAAVMVWLVPDQQGRASVVLMKRSPDPGVHGGQISFPGGKKEPADLDFYQTALRETMEEVGAEAECIRQLRPLSELYIPPSNFMVHPFLAYSADPQPLRPDPTEVEQILYLPLSALMDDRHYRFDSVRAVYGTLPNTCMLVFDGHVIWGATLMVLAELRALLRMIL